MNTNPELYCGVLEFPISEKRIGRKMRNEPVVRCCDIARLADIGIFLCSGLVVPGVGSTVLFLEFFASFGSGSNTIAIMWLYMKLNNSSNELLERITERMDKK